MNATWSERLTTRSWGRWSLVEDGLHFRVDHGEVDPGFYIEPGMLLSLSAYDEVRNCLRGKRWVREDDINTLSCAISAVQWAWRVETMNDRSGYPGGPMEWSAYGDLLSADWRSFLNSSNQRDESLFQEYLEQRPALLPDPYIAFGGGHNGLHLGGVVTQPELPGLRPKRPDFMMLAFDSANVWALLIEIEAPAKKWFNKNATPTADLTQALDQIRQWKQWMDEPGNKAEFRRLYGLDQRPVSWRTLEVRYILIYGRRAEFAESENLSKKRGFLAQPDEHLMTFDRLSANWHHLDSLTIKLDRSGPDTRWRLLSVPPTFAVTQQSAGYIFGLLDREAAIHSSPYLDSNRRQLLLDLLPIADARTREAPRDD